VIKTTAYSITQLPEPKNELECSNSLGSTIASYILLPSGLEFSTGSGLHPTLPQGPVTGLLGPQRKAYLPIF